MEELKGGPRQVLSAMLTAGVIGFGGGSALIPVMERLTVHKGLLAAATYTRHVVVANITPGALPVKLAAAAGLNRGGARLSTASALVVALPGALATLLLMVGISALGEGGLNLLNFASVGITAFIIALLAGYVIKVHSHAGSAWPKFALITAVTAAATGANVIAAVGAELLGLPEPSGELPQLSAVQVILAALVAISVASLVAHRGEERSQSRLQLRSMTSIWRATAAFAVLTALGLGLFVVAAGTSGLAFGSLLALSTITAFGGGEAYIAVADGFFVQPGLIDAGVFYTQLVPIANALPGPILVKVGVGSSYLFGVAHGAWQGWALGGAGLLITVGACCALAVPVLGLYKQLKDHPVIVGIGRYILPVICGLLVSVAATMLEVSAGVMEDVVDPVGPALWVLVAAAAILTVLHVRKLAPDLVLLAVAGVLSLVALLLV
ncbi:chromate transporter [Tessaracoccus flavus]|uniref:Uncharacterized protein n=1 Tax=Tessaracoccus flavus TaxID=1610493 RepID=A0A1Q2CI55_9ACTN|nr:chromate transporter [Tessaracoccus flavus]AQP45806.1 hypothetical protein RPIT_14160 [Tessaracoccus flavus]SDZ14403.1 Chromate transport protein ChrA [Tessaracoccus flavus]